MEIVTEGALYNRLVNNWITWYGSAILTPHNIWQVWSRGTDWSGTCVYHLNPVIRTTKQQTTTKNRKDNTLRFGWNYAYTLSTTRQSALSNDYSVGKQIPYVPRYQYNLHLAWQLGAFEVKAIHTYMGYRFITTDESQYLKPLHLNHAELAYTMHGRSYRIQYRLRISNIFNCTYQGVVGRYMPGRTVSLGVSVL